MIFVTLEPISADFEDTPPLPVTVILPHLNQLEVLLKKPRPADIHVFNSIFTILHAPQLRLVVHDLGPQLEAEAATFLRCGNQDLPIVSRPGPGRAITFYRANGIDPSV